MNKFTILIVFVLFANLVCSQHLRNTQTSGSNLLNLGAYTQQAVDLNDIGLQQSLTTAMQALETNQLSNGQWVVDAVLSVSTQVVAGVNYQVDVKLSDISQTPPVSRYMEWVVFIQPWTNTTNLTSAQDISLDVGVSSSNGQKAGGWSEVAVDLSDPGLQQALQSAMTTLASTNGPLAEDTWRIDEVWSVATQIVSGVNYAISVKLVNSAGVTRNMQWVVWVQVWTNTVQLLSYQDIVLGSTLFTIIYFEGVANFGN